jgi:hypothetical protein
MQGLQTSMLLPTPRQTSQNRHQISVSKFWGEKVPSSWVNTLLRDLGHLHPQCTPVWGRVCNFFDNSRVPVSDFFKENPQWKLEISNNRLGPGFINVSEQRVWGGSGGSMHLKVGIQSRVFIKTLPNILLSSLNYSGSWTQILTITLDFLPRS